MNTNQVHFNAAFAERTRLGQVLVNSCLTLSIVTGLSVPDTSENALANLSWTDIRLPRPVFVGDTLWAPSEITETRASRSTPHVRIVGMRSRGINQRGETVLEFRRAFMAYRRDAPELVGHRPAPIDTWSA
jgi:itaconyl-CoA hydratase